MVGVANPVNDEYAECGHQWWPEVATTTGPHLCRKHPTHTADITDDDHRCCCGASTWRTE